MHLPSRNIDLVARTQQIPVFGQVSPVHMTLPISPDEVNALEAHGEEFSRARGAYLGAPNLCFQNAAWFAVENPGWRYVEGAAVVDGVFFHHAWVTDLRAAYEVTLASPAGRYFGVALSDSPGIFCPGLHATYGGVLDSWLARLASFPASSRHRRPKGWDSLPAVQLVREDDIAEPS